MSLFFSVVLLLLNFVLLIAGFYFLNSYFYFSSICMKSKKITHEQKNIWSPEYQMFLIQGPPGKLAGYFLEGSSKKTVILVHGWMDNAESRLEDAILYQKMGYSIFLPDLRAHGKSAGKYLGMGMADGQDLKDWILYLKDRQNNEEKILLDGVSFGAAAILHIEPDFLNQNVSAIISDSCFDNPAQLFQKMLRFSPLWLGNIYLYGINLFCRRLGKFNLKCCTTECIKQIKIPVLLIGGALDKLVPIETQQELRYAAAGPCSLYIEEDASHARAASTNRARYNNAIENFLQKIG